MAKTEPLSQLSVLLSQSEVEALAAKAARGVGLPWGLAEEAGFAAGWVHKNGIEAMTPLLRYLEVVQSEGWDQMRTRQPTADIARPARSVPLCPISLGATLLDFASLSDDLSSFPRVGPIAWPVLILPFLATTVMQNKIGVQITLAGEPLTITARGQLLYQRAGGMARLHAAETGFLIRDLPAAADVPAPTRPVQPTPLSVLHHLERLALNTTVPATSASRADAGSTGSDND